MEKATRMLNMLSAIIMTIAGCYIHLVFAPLLSSAAVVLLWVSILIYAVMQVEFGYGVLRKQIQEIMR